MQKEVGEEDNETKLIKESNILLEKLHAEYRKLIAFQRELNGRYSLKYKQVSLFIRIMEEEIRNKQGNYIENIKYRPLKIKDNKHVKWLKIFNKKKSVMIKYKDRNINKNQSMTEFNRNQSDDFINNNISNKKSKKDDNKSNKFEFRDFKPTVFAEQKYGDSNLFNNKINTNSAQQQYQFNQNRRSDECSNQIYNNSYNNSGGATRNPFSTHRQMPNIPQTHRGHININNLNSVYESHPKVNTPMQFNNMNINRHQNYNMRLPPVNIQNINSQYINNQPNYMISPSSYNKNTTSHSISYNQRNSLIRDRLLNQPHQNINSTPFFNRESDNYIPLNNPILGIDDSLRILNNKQKKIIKREKREKKTIDMADSLQSLSSGETDKEKKTRIKLKKTKAKIYTHFYSKTDVFNSDSVRGYDITQDPCSLFEAYNVLKKSSFTPKQLTTCNLLKEIEIDMTSRLNLRKITNLLIYIKNTKRDRETEILKEFLGRENSIVFLNTEEVEEALKIMYNNI